MKKTFTWFLIFTKRYLKRVSFWVMILLMPLSTFIYQQMKTKTDSGIKIAISQEGNIQGEVMKDLLQKEGYITFYGCEDREEVIKDVASRKAECGYILSADLDQKARVGEELSEEITAYYAPSSILHNMAKELVFASIMNVYGETILEDAIDGQKLFANVSRKI